MKDYTLFLQIHPFWIFCKKDLIKQVTIGETFTISYCVKGYVIDKYEWDPNAKIWEKIK